ncbi:hypothetical protein PIB30_065415 [Stylosanthes scabra]|uniref:Replication factor A C-terminal domain-containing protein n=1 Tax=Stylosanthes scabra TaxID=79078 RepID=A0ABU6ZKR1_9FABA|nr:hypothetical protein [Stylosanthes scabra]
MAKKVATALVDVLSDYVADVHARKLGWNLVVGVNPWSGLESYSMYMVLEYQWGDHIHCTIPKARVNFFRTCVREHEIKVLAANMQNHLVDCIGHVVGKEDPKELEKQDEMCPFWKASRESGIIVVFINPNSEDVATFKRSLLSYGEVASQRITHVKSQSRYYASDGLSGEARCWVLADVVSVEASAEDWYYASCNDCKTNLKQIKNRYVYNDCGRDFNKPPMKLYHFNAILSDGTGCVTVVLWNEEAKLILGKTATEIKQEDKDDKSVPYPSALNSIVEKKFLFKLTVEKKNISGLDTMYSVYKIYDDERIIGIYSSQASGLSHVGNDEIVSLPLGCGETHEVQSILDGFGVESAAESNFDEFFQTLVKCNDTEAMMNSAVTSLCSP